MNNNEVITLEMFEDAKKYWLMKLAGELNELNLPSDLILAKQQENLPHKIAFGNQLTEQLMHISKENQLSLYVILLTVLKILLAKFTGQTDIIVASSTLTSSSQSYNKCIVFRDLVDNRMTFKELLMNVKQTVSNGCKNQHYPFRKIVKILDIENKLSLFRVVFILKSIQDIEFVNIMTADLEKDLIFMVGQTHNQLEGTFTWNSKMFSIDTIRRLGTYYLRILEQTLNQTDIQLSEIRLITEEEKRQLLVEFNDTGKEFPGDRTIHRLFEEEAHKKPDKIVSVGFGREQNNQHPLSASIAITYKELNTDADRLAAYLRGCGIRSEEIVGIIAEPSIRLITGILAILKAGGAYLPVDSDYPPERIRYMLTDSHTNLLLTEKKILKKLEEIEFKGRLIDPDDRCVDQKTQSICNPGPRIGARHLAYVIYTSGSTGYPKGVMVEHRNVVRLVHNPRFIDLEEEDKLLLTGVIGFDIVTFEIWAPFLNGITLYLPDEHIILDAVELEQTIAANKITLLHLVPQLFNRLAVQRPGIFSGLKCLLVGGDVVRPGYVNQIKNRYSHLKILHMYGPTENTTFSTCFAIDKDYETKIPLGKPIDNSILYILDEKNLVQPLIVKGELCTGGYGVARGYLNNMTLTKEKFINDPYHPGGKFYKTGDIARWLPDGNIEFFGRCDQQLKIRGVRVELEEIENHLLKHNKLKETVVIAIETRGDMNETEQELCAYFTAKQECSTTELREWLSRDLPIYMIPSYFVQLHRMPLTPNGKIDRKALPIPNRDTLGSEIKYTAPRDSIEIILARQWSEILGVKKVGIDDNFFRSGGHSLKAMTYISLIQKELNVKIPLAEIFNNPTIRGLSRYIRKAKQEAFTSINKVEKCEFYPLSSQQKRIYVHLQKIPYSTIYNIHHMLLLKSHQEKDRLKEGFNKLIKRHESLRTSFTIVDGEPVQRIHETVMFDIEYYDLISSQDIFTNSQKASGTSPAWKENPDVSLIIKNFSKPFELSKTPLLKLGLIKIENGKSILIVDVHHIIFDGVSNSILMKEFTELMQGKELPLPKIQYKDYAVWQNSKKGKQAYKMQETFWLREFDGKLPVLNIPMDFERPTVQNYEGNDEMTFEITSEETDVLKKIAMEEKTTLFVVLQTIYYIFLSKITNQEDIIIGIVSAGRGHADLENVIGMFVNPIALRNYPKGEKTFKEILHGVREKNMQALENQEFSIEDLLKRLGIKYQSNRHPLGNVGFTLENGNGTAMMQDNIDWGTKRITADLILYGLDDGKKVKFAFKYSTELFKQETIARFISYFKEIVSILLKNKEIILNTINISHGLYDKKLTLPQADFGF